jgi:hypothetical protein
LLPATTSLTVPCQEEASAKCHSETLEPWLSYCKHPKIFFPNDISVDSGWTPFFFHNTEMTFVFIYRLSALMGQLKE